MNQMNRRELSLTLSAFAMLGSLSAAAQSETTSDGSPKLIHSALFSYGKLPVKIAPNGMQTRAVLHGTLATGEYIEVHETTLPAGEMPHPPHRHTHSELLLIREGELQVDSGGQQGIVHPGDVVFTASAVLHSLKNVGRGPATYFVVAVGVQRALS
jgi:mannose-6-phosphate isomerase-like protein (cupin superfamily)